jgi:hypothetical protein
MSLTLLFEIYKKIESSLINLLFENACDQHTFPYALELCAQFVVNVWFYFFL